MIFFSSTRFGRRFVADYLLYLATFAPLLSPTEFLPSWVVSSPTFFFRGAAPFSSEFPWIFYFLETWRLSVNKNTDEFSIFELT